MRFVAVCMGRVVLKAQRKGLFIPIKCLFCYLFSLSPSPLKYGREKKRFSYKRQQRHRFHLSLPPNPKCASLSICILKKTHARGVRCQEMLLLSLPPRWWGSVPNWGAAASVSSKGSFLSRISSKGDVTCSECVAKGAPRRDLLSLLCVRVLHIKG